MKTSQLIEIQIMQQGEAKLKPSTIAIRLAERLKAMREELKIIPEIKL